MPTRIFAFADMSVVSEGYNIGPTINYDDYQYELQLMNPGTFNFVGNGTFEADPLGSGALATRDMSATYHRNISVVYDGVSNPIPPTAAITKVVYRAPFSYNLDGTSQSNNMVGFARVTLAASSTPGNLSLNNTASTIYQATNTQADSVDGSDADIVMFDDPDNPISRDDLIATFGDITLTANFLCRSQATGSVVDACTANFNVEYHHFEVHVTYIDLYSFEFPDPERDGSFVTLEPGVELEVITDLLDPEQVEELWLQPLDINGDPIGEIIPIEFTIVDNNIIFITPDFPSDTYFAQFNITSTQFSGTLTLGQKLVLYFYNAPGIYKFVPGQRFDTYYNRPGEGIGDEATFNTQIPRPFVRTGYV